MPATTDSPGEFAAIRTQRHPRCWVCAQEHETGLAIRFEPDENGAVEGVFPCGEEFTGYPGFLHGGIASALLDGAMTNCLMARGTPGLTARLEIRYRHPVRINQSVTVKAWWEQSRGPLHFLGAELVQGTEVVVTSTARFMEYPEDALTNDRGGNDEEDRNHHL